VDTGLGFEPLLKYDGFTEEEGRTGKSKENLLDTIEKVRV
jgi:hypothetical protein